MINARALVISEQAGEGNRIPGWCVAGDNRRLGLRLGISSARLGSRLTQPDVQFA